MAYELTKSKLLSISFEMETRTKEKHRITLSIRKHLIILRDSNVKGGNTEKMISSSCEWKEGF